MNLLRDENLNWRRKVHELCTDYDLLNESHKKYVMVSVERLVPNVGIAVQFNIQLNHKTSSIQINIDLNFHSG